jgi:hypothetical protein
MFVPLVLLPLIVWAVSASALAVVLYLRLDSAPKSLFDRMPDLNGDTPGVKKSGKLTLRFKKSDALAPLPDHLHVRLGQTLAVGDLEVTPLAVERKRMRVIVGASNPEPLRGDSLVLRLRLRNTASDYSFAPMDNYFDRRWDGKSGDAPLTVLVAGEGVFFGGPAPWYRLDDRQNAREWVEGRQKVMPMLEPGKSMETFVCTDGDDPKVLAGVARHKGKLLWRVNLRRGLIDHKGRLLPAQCVVGVEFTAKDYGGG